MNDRSSTCVPCRAVPALDDPALCDELASLAKALAHPARVRIMRILLASDACMCGDIVDQVPLAQSTVSQHLKVLKEAGLVVGEIDGPRVCYCADLSVLKRGRDLMERLLAIGSMERVRHEAGETTGAAHEASRGRARSTT